jgi:N-acetylglucosamine kinase-like BadF-type ATPase
VADREKDIAELQVRVTHHKNEGDIEANRLAEERDRLRNYIA